MWLCSSIPLLENYPPSLPPCTATPHLATLVILSSEELVFEVHVDKWKRNPLSGLGKTPLQGPETVNKDVTEGWNRTTCSTLPIPRKGPTRVSYFYPQMRIQHRPTSCGWQHVRQALPGSHHLGILFQVCKVLPHSDSTVILRSIEKRQCHCWYRRHLVTWEQMEKGKITWNCNHGLLNGMKMSPDLPGPFLNDFSYTCL